MAYRQTNTKLETYFKTKINNKNIFRNSYLTLSWKALHAVIKDDNELKGNLHYYNKLTLNRWKLSLKFNYPKNNWKYDFSVQKNGYEYRLFLLLNFPRAAILNIYDVTWLPNCCIQKNVDS